MKCRVEVWCGAAGSGRTSHLLALFRDELRRLQTRGDSGPGGLDHADRSLAGPSATTCSIRAWASALPPTC